MTLAAVLILLLAVACIVLGVLAGSSRAWLQALVDITAGVVLALVAFGVLP